jgi:2-C-methyl-D-erythritol 4-phosphate cytidylyltransferase
VEGSSLNFKITTKSDLDLFRIISDIEIVWFNNC